jgi:hypothetical protein
LDRTNAGLVAGRRIRSLKVHAQRLLRVVKPAKKCCAPGGVRAADCKNGDPPSGHIIRTLMLNRKKRRPTWGIDVQVSRRFDPVASLWKLAAAALARAFASRRSMKSLVSIGGLTN